MIQLLKGEALRHLFFITLLLSIASVGHSSAFTLQDTLRADTAFQPATQTQADTIMAAGPLAVTSALPTMHSDHLLRGERLFFGLVYFADKAVNCAACHTMYQADTMNWNPGASEISLKYLNKGSEELENVLLRPAGKKMAEAHASIDLTSQDVVMIKGFMDHIAREGIKEPKPVINRLLLFIFFSLLFLFSIVDLVFLKLTKRKLILLLTILISITYITNTLVKEAIAIGRSQFYQPDQPVKFSHMVHATLNQTECLYCHTTAGYSHSAGIPSVNHCMNCHIIVRDGTNSGRFEIAKVVDSYDNKMPIQWIRVHNLPHHVAFPHDQHVGVVGLDCAECHGEVEKMDKVMQVNDLSMGWCLGCHRTREMDIMSNDFYSVYMKLREDVLAKRTDMVTARMTGGTECMKCHY